MKKSLLLLIGIIILILIFFVTKFNTIHLDDVSDHARQAIAQHDQVNLQDIKIIDVKQAGKVHWLVSYQIKDNMGIWTPSSGWYIVDISKHVGGSFEASFIHY